MKKDFEKLLDIFKRQLTSEVKGDWISISYEIEENEEGDIAIKIKDEQVGFTFDKKSGRLKFIYNWRW